MLGQNFWNFNTIEKIIQSFGYIFDDIFVERINPQTQERKIIKVPVVYSPKEKWAVREIDDPNAGDEERQKHVQIILPRLAYELKDLRYDSHRKLPTINYRVAPSGNGPSALVQLNPVPMIFSFTLGLQTRTLSDAWMIISQIMAFFRPDYTVPIKDIPEMNINRDIVVTLVGNSHTDTYEGPMSEKRVIEWDFEFEAQGHIYPPIKIQPVITQAVINIDDQKASVTVEASPRTGNLDDSYDIVETIAE
jgi:T4-like virus Myoviridae tail sheath stabiliser